MRWSDGAKKRGEGVCNHHQLIDWKLRKQEEREGIVGGRRYPRKEAKASLCGVVLNAERKRGKMRSRHLIPTLRIVQERKGD